MKPLLHITSVPIAIEYKVTRAALKQSSTTAKVDVSRSRGANEIRTTRPEVKHDSTEPKASMGLKTRARLASDHAENAKSAGNEAVQAIAEEGTTIVKSHGKGSPIADIAMSRVMRSYETALAFIPSSPPSFSVEQGSISFNYSMDRLTFDWNTNEKPQMEYVPGSIEFTVTQHPSLTIEYLGGPLYVPPSSDPDYEPIEGLDDQV